MTVMGRLEMVAFDAPDIERLSSFYAELTGWKIARKEPDWITIAVPGGPPGAEELAFQLAPDHIPPQWPGQELPQHFHLDIDVDGHLAAAERAVALGATRLAEGSRWVTLADPAGHPFDLCQTDGIEGMRLAVIVVDAPDPSRLAHFYAGLMGLEVAHDNERGAAFQVHGRYVFFQPVAGYNPPQWPDPAAPQQAHFDILVDDLDAGEARVVELGATSMNSGGKWFRVFTDPAGHPFCLTTPHV